MFVVGEFSWKNRQVGKKHFSNYVYAEIVADVISDQKGRTKIYSKFD